MTARLSCLTMTRLPGSWMIRRLPSTCSWRPFCTSSKRRGPGPGGATRATGGALAPPNPGGGVAAAGGGAPTPGLAGVPTLSGDVVEAWPGGRRLGMSFLPSGARDPSFGRSGGLGAGGVCLIAGGGPGGGGGGGALAGGGGGGGGAFGGAGGGGAFAGGGGALGGGGGGVAFAGGGGAPFCLSRSLRFFSSSLGDCCAWARTNQPERSAATVPATAVNESERSRQLPSPSWRPIVIRCVRVGCGAHGRRIGIRERRPWWDGSLGI